jgi:hypothetical protein
MADRQGSRLSVMMMVLPHGEKKNADTLTLHFGPSFSKYDAKHAANYQKREG